MSIYCILIKIDICVKYFFARVLYIDTMTLFLHYLHNASIKQNLQLTKRFLISTKLTFTPDDVFASYEVTIAD